MRSRFPGLSQRSAWVDLLRDEDAPQRTALSAGLGALISATPIVGVHTWLSGGLAALLRLPPLAAVLASNVSNPLTFAPLTLLEVKIGCWLLGQQDCDLIPDEFSVQELGPFLMAAWLGSIPVGLGLGALTYGAVTWLGRRFRREKASAGETDG